MVACGAAGKIFVLVFCIVENRLRKTWVSRIFTDFRGQKTPPEIGTIITKYKKSIISERNHIATQPIVDTQIECGLLENVSYDDNVLPKNPLLLDFAVLAPE